MCIFGLRMCRLCRGFFSDRGIFLLFCVSAGKLPKLQTATRHGPGLHGRNVWADVPAHTLARMRAQTCLFACASPSLPGPSPPPAAIAHAVEELVQREADLLNSCFPHSRRAAPPWPSPLPTTNPATAPGGPLPQPIAPAAPPPTPSPVLTPAQGPEGFSEVVSSDGFDPSHLEEGCDGGG